MISINIDQELGISYQDAGPWRSYHVQTAGHHLGELLDNAWIYEVDQDGGDLGYYRLNDCETEEIFLAAWKIILKAYKEKAKV